MALGADDQKLVFGPEASEPGTLTEPRQFNLMFESHAGPVKDESNKVWLRPETAQGIFLDYKNVLDSTRVRPPFGIAQIGKSFRNEVNPRNFIFRSREFEQMEMEFFCAPEESRQWYEFWVAERMKFWLDIGVKEANLKIRHHDEKELAFYSTATADIEYAYPFTAPDFGELEGVAHRGNYDLTQHQTHSKTKLEFFDQEKNARYLPHVIEPAAGLTRALLVLLCEAYTVDEKRPSPEVMKFHPKMAPIKVGVFPLVDKDGMPEIARPLYLELRKKYTPSTTASRPSASATPAWTRPAPRTASPSTARRRRTRPSRSAIATRAPRSASPSTRSIATSPNASAEQRCQDNHYSGRTPGRRP